MILNYLNGKLYLRGQYFSIVNNYALGILNSRSDSEAPVYTFQEIETIPDQQEKKQCAQRLSYGGFYADIMLHF